MKKVLFTLKTPVAVLKDGKPVIEYKDATEEVIVASTKSQNKAKRKYASKGVTVVAEKAVDIVLDRELVEKAVDKFVAEQIKDNALCVAVAEFIKGKLAGACLYAKTEEEE